MLLHEVAFTQPTLHWSRTFQDRVHMNQSKVAVDTLGNTYCLMVCQGTLVVPDVHLTIPHTAGASNLVVKMNRDGKVVQAIDFRTTSWRGIAAMECSPSGELWVLAPYHTQMQVRMPGKEWIVKDSTVAYGALLMTVMKKDGTIRLCKNIEVQASDNMLDLSFDTKGNAHIISQRIDRIMELGEGMPDVWRERMHLLHHYVNAEGEVLHKDDFFMPANVNFSLWDSHIHTAPDDGFYITTKYQHSVNMNGVDVIVNNDLKPDEYTSNEFSAVLMRFDSNGKFQWHKSLFGYGNQWITDITSDSTNVYFSTCYSYECNINQKNKFFYQYKTPKVGNGLMYAAVSHNGQLKWTKEHFVRNYSGATLNCFGLETDRLGQLLMFCNFSDSVAIKGKYKDYTLLYDRWQNGCNFFMLCDTLGEVLELRNDLVQRVGSAQYTDVAAHGSRFAATGWYMPGMKNYYFDNEMRRMVSNEWDTEIQVSINGKMSEPFPKRETHGGIFCYSFTQPKHIPQHDYIEPMPEPADTIQYVYDPEPILTDTTLLAQNPMDVSQNTSAPDFALPDTLQILLIDPVASNALLSLRLHPNPTRHWLNVEVDGLEEFCTLLIHDLRGQLVFSSTFFISETHYELSHDVEAWAADTYILTMLSGGNKKVSKRWVKTG